ncbi:tetratricopeptide repeat protein [Muricoccus radiodurans]|uniref:tetratricopeptide repeat protein n=1 Tax=Muricoccus radiodurans TaxID=2231721 RepID=UPI003CF8382F
MTIPMLAAAGLLLLAGPVSAQILTPPGGGAGVAPAVPPTASPVPAPDAAARRRQELDRLLDGLPLAPDEAAATALQTRIQALWAQGGSPAVSLLIRRGLRNLEGRAAADAVEDLDAAITLQPDFAESWILRAQALAASGDSRAAAADLQQALRLEPRHFGALLALSEIQQESGDLNGALRSLDAALALHPHLPGGTQRRRDLSRQALGDDT